MDELNKFIFLFFILRSEKYIVLYKLKETLSCRWFGRQAVEKFS